MGNAIGLYFLSVNLSMTAQVPVNIYFGVNGKESEQTKKYQIILFDQLIKKGE